MLATTRVTWRVVLALVLLLVLVGCAGPSHLAALPADLPQRIELTETPFYPQTDHQCGPAALATVLGAAGHTVDPSVPTAEIYLPAREGSLQPEIAATVRARGMLAYETGPTLADLLADVAAGRPVLILQRLGAGPWPGWHFAVVIGYDRPRGQVLLRSGSDRRVAMTASRFEATWDRGGRWALVALEPGALPAHADLARYMRAASALEANQKFAAARLSYATAARSWPQSPMPRLGLGNVAAAQGDWHEAAGWYRSVLADDPSQAAALNNLAEVLHRSGCTDAARLALRTGMMHVADDDPLRTTLAVTLHEVESAPISSAPLPAECTQVSTP